MRKIRILLMLAATLSIQASFADDMSPRSRDCATIAKACVGAGYVRAENANKKFWQDCMNPILLGKVVEGVTIDPGVVKACRDDKIKDLQKELSDLQNAAK